MKNKRFLTIKQKIASFIVMLIAYINPYTLAASYAKIWWDDVLGYNAVNVTADMKANSIILTGIVAALNLAAPLCKTYCYYFFPAMFALNLILMAVSKDDKAMGACKTALITEIAVLFLMILFPSILWEGIKATGSTAN